MREEIRNRSGFRLVEQRVDEEGRVLQEGPFEYALLNGSPLEWHVSCHVRRRFVTSRLAAEGCMIELSHDEGEFPLASTVKDDICYMWGPLAYDRVLWDMFPDSMRAYLLEHDAGPEMINDQ